MPIPKPRRNEKSDEFIGRCMTWMADNEPERPQKQRLAMCYSSLRSARGKGVAPPKKKEQTPGVQTPLLMDKKKELTASELMGQFVAEVQDAWKLYEASEQLAYKEEEQMTTRQRKRIPEKLGTGGYACKTKGGEWKLPIHDAAHARNAAARYNQTDGCQSPEVKARICAAMKHFGIESDWCKKKEEQPDTAYCVKCKAKVKIKNPKEVTTDGKKSVTGTCPKCGTKVHHYYKEEECKAC